MAAFFSIPIPHFQHEKKVETLFCFFRRLPLDSTGSERSSVSGSPPAKQICTSDRAVMTTQAVTPSSAAAGLGLLNHPSMNFMMMHGIAGVHGIGGMGHGGLNPLAMLQNLQSPMGGHGYSAIAGHGAFPPSSIASNTPTPPHLSQQTATPAMPPTAVR